MEVRMARKVLLALAMAMVLVAGLGAGCAPRDEGEFPSRTIDVVVYHTAGGGTDRMIRALAGNWPTYADVPMRIINMPAGGSTEGAIFVRDADPDGYTLLGISSFMVTTPLTRPELNIGLEKFRMLFNLTTAPTIIVVPGNSPFNTLQEFIDYAKANPGKLSYGSSGTGGDQHVGMEAFCNMVGIKLTHVPLEGGAEALAMLLGGHIDASLGSLGSMLPQIESGALKCLVMIDTERSTALPDVPTTVELGIDFQWASWRGIAAPADLSDERAEILIEIGRKCMEDPGLTSMITALGEKPTFMAGDEYRDYAYAMRDSVVPVIASLA
jgi:tripartite-type tricarboxylate transporter receptor subunit TctC